jgi:hypothetical protein
MRRTRVEFTVENSTIRYQGFDGIHPYRINPSRKAG